MNNMPKVSVIMPVHNAAEFLEQSVGSVINQTLKDIELVCVDDGSTDSSYEILKQYAINDERVKVFHFDTSRSALVARKKGVSEAKGEYIMFLDADDYYSLNACEIAYSKITEKNVDIFHFSAGIVDFANMTQSRIDEIVKYMKPYNGVLNGEKVLESCFIEDLYAHTPVNKIYRADLCKKAYNFTEDKRFLYAEDLYAYFIISYFADSYYGCDTEPLYYYCYGRGITNNDLFSIAKFKSLCSHAEILKALKRFSQIESIDIPNIEIVLEKYKKEWFRYCISVWKNKISQQDAAEGLQNLYDAWGVEETVAYIAENNWAERKSISKRIGKLKAIPIENKDIKTIAFHYYRYSVGGAERVISLLMPMFMEMGYKVVLITEEKATDNDFELPDGVKRVIIENSAKINFKNRIRSWKSIIEENNIDLVLYNAWEFAIFFWDMLYLKGIGVSVIMQTHGVFSTGLTEMKLSYSTVPNTYRLADAVIALSNTDKLFYEAYNDRVYYIPNPISRELFNVNKVNFNKKALVWVGRASEEKNPEAAFEIMKRIVAKIPDAILYMVGDFNDSKWENVAKEYGIDKNIMFTGFVNNVSEYLEKASVHIMTSSFEGFPMALVEAKAHSMPTVMFNLPHLELGKREYGTISVDMLDFEAAASEAIKLLTDEEYWKYNSKNSDKAAEYLKKYDYKSAWNNVLTGKEITRTSNRLINDFIYTVDTHYELGIKERDKYRSPQNIKEYIYHAVKLVKTKGIMKTLKVSAVYIKNKVFG